MHARQRRLLSHAFSDNALRDQEGVIRGYVDTMISKLRTEAEKENNASVDIKSWMNYTTFDIMGDLMFGESFDCLKDSQLHPWIKLIFSSIKALSIAGAAQQFPILQVLLKALIPKEVTRKAKEHFDLAARRVDRRLDANIARPDFMSAILQNGLSEEKGQYLDTKRIMSRAEIHSNAFMYAVALLFPPVSYANTDVVPVSLWQVVRHPPPFCPAASSTSAPIRKPCVDLPRRSDRRLLLTRTSPSAVVLG